MMIPQSAPKVEPAIAEELASGYSSKFRWVEIFSIASFAVLISRLCFVIWGAGGGRALLVTSAALVGWLAADFASGLVHWGADTWGSAKFPVLGPTLIRSFREHHVDPMSITRHDFVETNGASCLVCLPVLVLALRLNLNSSAAIFAATALASLSFWTLMTNQAHQWAHQGARAKPWVKSLQKMWVILPSHRHAVHHQAPFVESYCITTGWLNPLLNRLGLFRGLERLITRLTGEMPRLEDLKLTNAARKPASAVPRYAPENGRAPK